MKAFVLIHTRAVGRVLFSIGFAVFTTAGLVWYFLVVTGVAPALSYYFIGSTFLDRGFNGRVVVWTDFNHGPRGLQNGCSVPQANGSEEFECFVLRRRDHSNGCKANVVALNYARRDPYSTNWWCFSKGGSTRALPLSYSREGFQRYPDVREATRRYFRGQNATYEITNSPVPLVYYPDIPFPDNRPTPANISGISGLVWIASNCVSFRNERNALVRGLMNRVPVYSVAACMNNVGVPSPSPVALDTFYRANGSLNAMDSKFAVMRNYKMALALENQNERDYVTEKVYHALIAGVVPVYFGAPNINDFIPHPNSIVNAADFDDLDALGDYIRELLSDDDKLMRHHEWRNYPLPKWFIKKFEPFMEPNNEFCRMCKYYYALSQRYTWNRETQEPVN